MSSTASWMSQHLYSIYPGGWPLVAESRVFTTVQAEAMDELWAVGWRHFGPDFFRASLMADEMSLKRQIALRIEVAAFERSKSQRRTYRRNEDLVLSIAGASPGPEEECPLRPPQAALCPQRSGSSARLSGRPTKWKTLRLPATECPAERPTSGGQLHGGGEGIMFQHLRRF